ncbi:MAG TPA: hypothetical protein VEA80_01485 [Vitreimonas sp.]|uniref:hypothetical protein n=1 Tax=Vitreimonas sp. TaxID=3069702 RepID=UPI002D2F7DB0|nr:hypothetical protein [Vitreimonas sp.]HYD86123.1 hypothetical protein [Vitreimonas sp.]
MRFLHVFAAVAGLSLVIGASASAQQADEEIVVTGQRLREAAHQYAETIALAPARADQYARWSARLCPSIAGLAPSEAQTLIDHMALRAREVGVEAERSGCSPNLIIIFAPDANRLAREIVDTRRDLMGYYTADDVVTAGREALEEFATSARPVRWWHVSRTVTADGRQLADTDSRVGRGTADALAAAQGRPNEAAGLGNGLRGVEATRSQGTRTRRATRQDFSFALVIVDAPSVSRFAPAQVADYLAMAALVQLNPDADLSAFPSILNLFQSPETAPPGLTEWDRAYLQGLYSATREAANATRHRADIARRIAENVAQ